MRIKRWLPALLVLIIFLGCNTGTVFAANEDYVPIASRVDYMPDPRQPDTFVPPVYYGDGSEIPEPVVYHTTVENAAAELRNLLEDRETTIGIGFQTTSSDFDKRLEVFNKALEHTGIPTQGDYLAYQHGAFSYGWRYYIQGGIYYVTFTYDMTYYTTAEQEAQMNTAVDALLDELDVYDASDYEKISAVYDYICENVTYDYDGLKLDNETNNNKKIYTAYGALIDGTSVCQGYANLFYRLMLELGVDNRIVAGIGNGGRHAWNIVELNDLYYDVDATWDATYRQADYAYEYFLRCDENFEDHTRDAEFITEEFNNAYPMSESDYLYTIDSGTCGTNTIWALDSNDQLTISGTGAIESAPWISYYYKIKSIVIEPGITTIGDQVFCSFNDLNTVSIPDSVTNVGFAAFYACDSLKSVIYGGTQEKWGSIVFGSNNEDLTNATVLYISEIKFKSAAPTLSDNIAMSYGVSKTLFDEMGVTTPYLVVSFMGVETTITNYTEIESDDGPQYVFTFYNIAPNQMGETMTATIYATYNGEVYEGKTLEYSVAKYCYRMLRDDDVLNDNAYAELRTLLVDLLHYGAAAQNYTGYEGTLVDADLEKHELAWGTQTDPTLESKTAYTNRVDSPTASWNTVYLILDDAITMHFEFTTADITGLTVKITSDTNTEGWVLGASEFQSVSSNRYSVDFGGLDASQMRECVYVTVYNGDAAISYTLCYSVESYACKFEAADAAVYPYLAELVKAMMRYGDSAHAFVN